MKSLACAQKIGWTAQSMKMIFVGEVTSWLTRLATTEKRALRGRYIWELRTNGIPRLSDCMGEGRKSDVVYTSQTTLPVKLLQLPQVAATAAW